MAAVDHHDCLAVERFVSAARTESGPCRVLNEDRFVNLPQVGFWAVADGMGGHEAGDAAAQMTVDALGALVTGSFAPAPAAVHEAIDGVNNSLLQAGADTDRTSGSTIVALIADRGRYTCLWAGDSRAYVVRDGRLIPISHDHSVVQELVDAGLLSAAEARVHPRSNVITRAVGVVRQFRLEAVTGAIGPKDRFLLCSDGLTGTLEEQEIADILSGCALGECADRLMQAALDRQARDNVTFVVIQPMQ